MNKRAKIKQTLEKTRARRAGQKCFVLKFKINTQKLKADQEHQLKMMFLEGKWLYNTMVDMVYDKDVDFKCFNPLVKQVKHFGKDKSEVISDLEFLPAVCKQSLKD